ncbi:MAG: ComEC/Rec2 family competence protein [Chitinophagaceae bacterium]
MMLIPAIYFWKRAPFIRLLASFIIGIVIQWNCQIAVFVWWSILAISFLAGISFFCLSLSNRYKLGVLNGLSLLISFISIGGLITWHSDIRHSKNWIGHYYKQSDCLVVTVDESLVEKTKSLKANARITHLIENKNIIPVQGKIILYFKKDSLLPPLAYGSQLIFQKSLLEIKNSGNPGGFDYKRYSVFQGITYQVYLKPGDFSVLASTNKKWLHSFLDMTREKVLNILRTNIKGDKELGLAEALLIGYKDDLDKTLVQSYTNTGVVHIIAISGLHLGLIYWLLLLLLKPLQHRKYLKWVRPVIIILGLWVFSLLAGAQPSILRSAVMFTCIVLGENLSRKTSIYNTLALSAFILLCWNPYWLWDVGFQLSYSAVLSIIIFMRPVYNLFYTKNKLLDSFWKLNAVTIAAQILTLPVSIYHFHQFPMHFLLTNFVAVPLSSIIVLGEIFLCIISFVPVAASLAGKALHWLIWFMNNYVERIESLPFSLWGGLQINIPETIFLFLFITGISYWLFEKKKGGLQIGLIALLCFWGLRSFSFWQADRQQKIIVYNVSQHRAIDFIDGRGYIFTGDTDLIKNDFARNFHLKPSRTIQRVDARSTLNNLVIDKNCISFDAKNILLLDNTISLSFPDTKYCIDLLVISKNPKLYISRLNNSFDIKQIVFDGSVPAGKLKYWKKDCDSLHIPYYDVAEKGAFVMNLN